MERRRDITNQTYQRAESSKSELPRLFLPEVIDAGGGKAHCSADLYAKEPKVGILRIWILSYPRLLGLDRGRPNCDRRAACDCILRTHRRTALYEPIGRPPGACRFQRHGEHFELLHYYLRSARDGVRNQLPLDRLQRDQQPDSSIEISPADQA